MSASQAFPASCLVYTTDPAELMTIAGRPTENAGGEGRPRGLTA